MNSTVPSSEYVPAVELVLVVVLLWMVPLLTNTPSISAAKVPVPTVMVPAFER